MFNTFLGLCIYFCEKPVKMILENHSLIYLDSIWYSLAFSVHNIPSHFYALILGWMNATSLIMKYQLVLQVSYSVISVYILDVSPLWKINLYMTAFNWLRINNKCGFRLANRFAEREFFKFFITKITRLEPMNLPWFPSLSLPNPKVFSIPHIDGFGLNDWQLPINIECFSKYRTYGTENFNLGPLYKSKRSFEERLLKILGFTYMLNGWSFTQIYLMLHGR